eukprot:4019571-Prymnesium_polylepis.1
MERAGLTQLLGGTVSPGNLAFRPLPNPRKGRGGGKGRGGKGGGRTRARLLEGKVRRRERRRMQGVGGRGVVDVETGAADSE